MRKGKIKSESTPKITIVNPKTYNPVGKELPESIRRVIVRLTDMGKSVEEIKELIGVSIPCIKKYVSAAETLPVTLTQESTSNPMKIR